MAKATGDALRSKATGTTFAAITGDVLRQHPVPVPADGADRYIADRIDELFAEVEDGEAALARARDDLATWRKALLKAAVTGDLTAEWRAANPPAETGADLLARILAERQARWAKGLNNKDKTYREPKALAGIDLPALPQSWIWASLDQLSERITDGTHQPPTFTSEGVPFIVIKTICGGRIAWDTVGKFVSDATYRRETARLRPSRGDVLYTAVGSFGTAVEVTDDRDFMFQRHIAHVRPVSEVMLPAYLTAALNSPVGFAQADTMAKGVAQRTVTLGDLSRFHLPFPPLAEQMRIVDILMTMSAGDGNLADSISASDTTSTTLRQSILAAAFRGELA